MTPTPAINTAGGEPSRLAMEIAVHMEVHAALSTTTQAKAREIDALLEADRYVIRAADGAGVRVEPDNLRSHRQSWLKALERLVELEPERPEPDMDEKGFWRHELQAMRDMYADLDRLSSIEPSKAEDPLTSGRDPLGILAAFENWTKHNGSVDLTKTQDAWGRPTYKHSHVDAMWAGWRAAAAKWFPVSELKAAPTPDVFDKTAYNANFLASYWEELGEDIEPSKAEAGEVDDDICTGCRGTGYNPNLERNCDCAEGLALPATQAESGEVVASHGAGLTEEILRLAEVGEFLLGNCSYSAGDGQTQPLELSIQWEWQQSAPHEYGRGALLAQAAAWHDSSDEHDGETIVSQARAKLAEGVATSPQGKAGPFRWWVMWDESEAGLPARKEHEADHIVSNLKAYARGPHTNLRKVALYTSPQGNEPEWVTAAFRNVDESDWEYLFAVLPDTHRGKFWKAVMRDIEAALSGKGSRP